MDAKIRQPEERLGGALLRGRDRAGGRRVVHEGGTTFILYSTLWRGLRRATLGLESGDEAARTRTIGETCENWRGTSTSPPRCALNWFESTS